MWVCVCVSACMCTVALWAQWRRGWQAGSYPVKMPTEKARQVYLLLSCRILILFCDVLSLFRNGDVLVLLSRLCCNSVKCPFPRMAEWWMLLSLVVVSFFRLKLNMMQKKRLKHTQTQSHMVGSVWFCFFVFFLIKYLDVFLWWNNFCCSLSVNSILAL